jgi:hypothetical protein
LTYKRHPVLKTTPARDWLYSRADLFDQFLSNPAAAAATRAHLTIAMSLPR